MQQPGTGDLADAATEDTTTTTGTEVVAAITGEEVLLFTSNIFKNVLLISDFYLLCIVSKTLMFPTLDYHSADMTTMSQQWMSDHSKKLLTKFLTNMDANFSERGLVRKPIIKDETCLFRAVSEKVSFILTVFV